MEIPVEQLRRGDHVPGYGQVQAVSPWHAPYCRGEDKCYACWGRLGRRIVADFPHGNQRVWEFGTVPGSSSYF